MMAQETAGLGNPARGVMVWDVLQSERGLPEVFRQSRWPNQRLLVNSRRRAESPISP
jgi:hypothetical protein